MKVNGGLACYGLRHVGLSDNWNTLVWGPYSKDPTIQGTILGSRIFGKPLVGRQGLGVGVGVRVAVGVGRESEQQRSRSGVV